MTPEQIEKLRELAEKATPGKREARTEVGHPGVVAIATEGAFDWICSMQVSNRPRFKEDAQFIAACDRETVLVLLSELSKLREVAEAAAGYERAVRFWTSGSEEARAALADSWSRVSAALAAREEQG